MSNKNNFTIKETFNLAVQNHQNNNLQDAQNYYQKVLKIDPNHLAALNNLGATFKELEEYQKAKDCYEKAIEIDPNYIDAHYNLGVTFKDLGELQKAKSCYERIIEINPNYVNAHYNLGSTFKDLGELQKAKSCYERIIEINPNYVNAHNNLGVIFQELEEYQKAKDCYERIIEIDPDYASAHNNLGLIFQKLGELQKAQSCYDKTIEINPNFVDVHYNLGALFRDLGELQKAQSCYEKVIEINPNYVNAHNNLGATFKDLGELQKAKDCYERIIEIDPNYASAHNNLGATFKDLGELQKAKDCYEKAIAINPNFLDAHYNLGVTFKDLGELQKAKDCYEKAIETNPNSQVALINRGKILFEKEEFELSLIDFDNCNNFESRSCALTSLYALGHIDEIYKRIEENYQLDEKNIRVAAFSSFIAYKEKKSTTQNFCPNPIDFIHHSNLSSHLQNFNSFITEVIKELHNVNSIWEPIRKSTLGGFQTKPNLFIKPQKIIQNLKSIIITEIESYYLKFINETCSFIKKWPSKYTLPAWQVILKKQGHQSRHIHPSGWLSGVIYLKVVPSFKKNEGAIEFSLNGNKYYDAESPKVVHLPKTGDIVLFPSSLHHRTIPFSSDTDRISIAFDLAPNLKKES